MPITKIVTGPQLAALDDAAFAREVGEANVFARLTPDQKEKVIKTLRARATSSVSWATASTTRRR